MTRVSNDENGEALLSRFTPVNTLLCWCCNLNIQAGRELRCDACRYGDCGSSNDTNFCSVVNAAAIAADDLKDILDAEGDKPCAECGEVGVCGFDAESRPWVHAEGKS